MAAALAALLLSGCADRLNRAGSGGSPDHPLQAAVAGGVITDGADIAAITRRRAGAAEELEITFNRWAGYEAGADASVPMDRPCHFRVSAEDYPHGLRLVFAGVRAFSARNRLPGRDEPFRHPSLVRRIYPVVTLDDSALELVVALNRRVRFSVWELADPARVIIELAPEPGPGALKPLFSLRTASGVSGEPAAVLRERLAAKTGASPRWLADGSSLFLLEAGLYRRESEALAARERIRRAIPEANLLVERRLPSAPPARRR